MTQGRPTQKLDAQATAKERLPAAAVEAAYQEYHRDLLAFLLGVLKDGHLVQDALQQTFQRLAESGGQARSESLRGWLFQVAFREALQIRRKAQREDRHRQQWVFAVGAMEPLTPAENLVHRERLANVQAAINELPIEQRQILERRIHGDETFAEIAAATSTPLGTVLTRMRLAVERLRKRLRDG